VSRSPGDPTLPSDPSADRDVEARASPDKPLRILVVDDNRDAVEMLTMLLETLGHAVQSAFDGRRAVAVAAESTPDLILLDIGLPGLDGYEVCRRIRARSEAPRPTIVAVTGWGQDQDKEQARAAGFDHHVTKPLDVAVLRRLIQAHEHSG
jgi:CheY-like chemotaxis protein